MHSLLYVCLPRSAARTSLQARKRVYEYLGEQGFHLGDLRFAGVCDWYKVGGRWSGQLTMLRLEQEKRLDARKYWRLRSKAKTFEESAAAFRECFPEFRGPAPLGREKVPYLGYPDDAQILDKHLFRVLKKGFSDDVAWECEPNVIFTGEPDNEFQRPRTPEEAAKFWVVLIDYHW
jgi:hypothetical protein